jgi:hypothetical protein
MNKKILLSTLLISTVSLSACGIKKEQPKNPEDIIKTTQTNVIKSFKDTVLAKQKVKYNSNINLDISSPFGS